MPKTFVTAPLSITLDENRWRWLREMARHRGISVHELASAELHNAALHFQMLHAPHSDPEDSPTQAAAIEQEWREEHGR